MNTAAGVDEQVASLYRPTPSYLYRHRLYRRLLKRIVVKRFLDVGAGRGELAAWLLDRGARGVVLDTSPYAVRALRRRFTGNSRVTVLETDFLNYEPDSFFDLVIMNEILEHVKEDGAFVFKAGGLLNRGGYLLLSVPSARAGWGWRDVAKGHLRHYDREALLDLLGQASLRPIHFWSWGWPVINFLRSLDRKRKVKPQQPSEATARSGVVNDVLPPRWFLNSVFITPPFALMDVFLNGDRGVGYVVLARRGGV